MFFAESSGVPGAGGAPSGMEANSGISTPWNITDFERSAGIIVGGGVTSSMKVRSDHAYFSQNVSKTCLEVISFCTTSVIEESQAGSSG